MGRLTGAQRQSVVFQVWPELRTLGIGYVIGHGILVEAALDDDPKAPLDSETRRRIKEAAEPYLEKTGS
jgi:hypothetical protein